MQRPFSFTKYSLPSDSQKPESKDEYIYVTGCGPSASARALRDSGELRSSTERDSSFLCSTPGVVPSVPNAHSRINQPKPTCIQIGWRLRVTQKTILNTQCISHSCQGEGDPREECNDAHSPNPELILLLDPSPILDPCLAVFQEKGAPDDTYRAFYTAHEARDDIH